MIAYCVEQFARGHVQSRVVYTREQAEESAKRVRAALEYRCAIQVRGEEPFAQPIAGTRVASHELAKEHHEWGEQLVHRTVALGFRSCAHGGVVRLNCAWKVMRERDFKQAVCVEEGIRVWWAGRAPRRRRAGEG